MAKYQYPIDGGKNKGWKISSKMGWRIHPVQKTKKHHNGTDIFGLGKKPWYIEAFADGKVLKAQKSTAAGGGFGYYVVLLHKIDGVFYTSLYAHMEEGSIQVKVGQTVKAGTVLGKMGTTGMSTGVHLHWEIWKGKEHGWSADGKGFVEPVGFVEALMAAEKAKASADEVTPADAPAQPLPAHSAMPEEKPKPAAKPVAKPAAKPVAKPAAKVYTVKSGDTLGAIATKNKTTVANLVKINGLKDANKISVGQKIKLG
jgi:murein DD-endopeptidase MepM/ murein hydrolase activator NlpD